MQEPVVARPLSECGVLVSGGTSGVGLAAAKLYGARGVRRLAIVGRDPGRGAAACRAVLECSSDAQVVFISADANDPECAIFAAGEAYRQIGRVDVLLNSTVGSFQPELFHNIPMTDILPTLLQQVAAPLLMSRAILPQMRERRSGVILNIASDAGKLATPGEAVIGAATAGIVMFTRALAMEARRDGVRVNAITPSLIDNTGSLTRIRQSAFASRLFAKAGRAALLGLVQPEDMAELIVFLSSPAAKLMTGQAISLNGGISAA